MEMYSFFMLLYIDIQNSIVEKEKERQRKKKIRDHLSIFQLKVMVISI